jgi:hypothetical protein
LRSAIDGRDRSTVQPIQKTYRERSPKKSRLFNAQAATIDQVNDIRKKAMALAAYALQVNKPQLKEKPRRSA